MKYYKDKLVYDTQDDKSSRLEISDDYANYLEKGQLAGYSLMENKNGYPFLMKITNMKIKGE